MKISSVTLVKRPPVAAAFLSLFLPSLGQFYTFQSARAVAILLFICMCVMFPVLSSGRAGSQILSVQISAVLALVAWIYSVVQASIYSARRNPFPYRRRGGIVPICAYAVCALLLIAAACSTFASQYSLLAVNDDDARPSLLRGEVALVSAASDVRRGDLVVFDGAAMRVAALGRCVVRVSGGRIFFGQGEIALQEFLMRGKHLPDVYTETNMDSSYQIFLDVADSAGVSRSAEYQVGDGEILLLSDNRNAAVAKVVKRGKFRRVAGIILSPVFSRIFPFF